MNDKINLKTAVLEVEAQKGTVEYFVMTKHWMDIFDFIK